jgi:hypothetical protein
MAELRSALNGAVYCVLGNHDSIAMIPGLEGMGVRIEAILVERDNQRIRPSPPSHPHHW